MTRDLSNAANHKNGPRSGSRSNSKPRQKTPTPTPEKNRQPSQKTEDEMLEMLKMFDRIETAWPSFCLAMLVLMLVCNAYVWYAADEHCVYPDIKLPTVYSQHGAGFDLHFVCMLGVHAMADLYAKKCWETEVQVALGVVILLAYVFPLCRIYKRRVDIDTLHFDSAIVTTHSCNGYSIFPYKVCDRYSVDFVVATAVATAMHAVHSIGYGLVFVHVVFQRVWLFVGVSISIAVTRYAYAVPLETECVALRHYAGMCVACVVNIVLSVGVIVFKRWQVPDAHQPRHSGSGAHNGTPKSHQRGRSPSGVDSRRPATRR